MTMTIASRGAAPDILVDDEAILVISHIDNDNNNLKNDDFSDVSCST